jgi:hypothetical protein
VRTVLSAVALTHISSELREELQEDDGLGPMLPRSDLVAVIENAKAWSLWRIKAGETNIKSHMFISFLWAVIGAIRSGTPKAEFPALMMKAVKKAEDEASPILQKMAQQGSPDQAVNELNKMTLDRAADVFEDWDFMVGGQAVRRASRAMLTFELDAGCFF